MILKTETKMEEELEDQIRDIARGFRETFRHFMGEISDHFRKVPEYVNSGIKEGLRSGWTGGGTPLTLGAAVASKVEDALTPSNHRNLADGLIHEAREAVKTALQVQQDRTGWAVKAANLLVGEVLVYEGEVHKVLGVCVMSDPGQVMVTVDGWSKIFHGNVEFRVIPAP